jgi:hypothetical protein
MPRHASAIGRVWLLGVEIAGCSELAVATGGGGFVLGSGAGAVLAEAALCGFACGADPQATPQSTNSAAPGTDFMNRTLHMNVDLSATSAGLVRRSIAPEARR